MGTPSDGLANDCDEATLDEFPAPSMNQADFQTRVYVVRTSSVGSSIPMGIFDSGIDGTKIGRTGPRGFLCWERPPLEFEVRSRRERQLPGCIRRGR